MIPVVRKPRQCGYRPQRSSSYTPLRCERQFLQYRRSVDDRERSGREGQSGRWLVVKGATVEQQDQRGEITEVRSADGSPPYVVRWLGTDHEATVYPGADALM